MNKHRVAATIVWLALNAMGGAQDTQDVQDRQEQVLLVADFNTSVVNRLNGHANRFQLPPSTASVYPTTKIFHGSGGRSLCVTADRKDQGYCGAWMHFFNYRAADIRFFDSRPYTHLSFWVKGQKGGEQFTVRLSDEALIAIEDSTLVGPIRQFLPGGVTTSWQQVRVPLVLAWRLDRRNLGGVSFEFATPGRYEVCIDDIAFIAASEDPQPWARLKPAAPTSHPRAMWVWHTPEMLAMDAAQRVRFFEFCQREGIGHLWMQLLYVFETPVDLGPPDPRKDRIEATRCAIRVPESMRAFIRQAHRAGLKVYGLDGYPEFVQKPYHHCPLAIVDAVMAFNQASAPDERYDGIHFDNEPHLLIGWADVRRREQILNQFLDLAVACQRRVRQQPGMVFGVDIPFWWQKPNKHTGVAHGAVTFNGVRKAASYHCIDIVDNVGIMNYRDRADGPDGMVALGRELLVYGDTANRAKIYMGIETIADEQNQTWFAVGLPRDRFARVIRGKGRDFSYLSRVDEFRVLTFDDGQYVHVGVQSPSHPTSHEQERLERVKLQIARRFAWSADDDATRTRIGAARDRLVEALQDSIEWERPLDRDIHEPDSSARYAGITATHVMHPKITFGDNTVDHIHRETAAAQEQFQRYKSFGGIAIHYYKTFRRIVGADGLPQPEAGP